MTAEAFVQKSIARVNRICQARGMSLPAASSVADAPLPARAAKAPPVRKRGRPRQFDLDQAVQAATDLFRARGYDRVTLADLTGAMRINPSSFYAAFGNKAVLFTRIADAYQTQWLTELRTTFEATADLRAALEAILARAAKRFAWRESANGPWGGCLILESAANCSDALVVAHLRKARLAVAATLYRGVSRTAPDQVVLLTDHVMMLLAGLSSMGRDGVGAERLAAVAAQAARGLALP